MHDTDSKNSPRPDRLETLREKKAAIEAQIARLNIANAKEQRRIDTRKKILVGAVILAEAAKERRVAVWLQTQLDCGLKQPRDRVLFNLPPLDDNRAATDAPATPER